MKVAFVTPLEERSAIADVSLRVVQAVGRRWDVDLWYPACDRPRFTTLPTMPFHRGEDITGGLSRYDLAVYVLGDSPYHLEILAAAREVPGLVVMHDRSLTHLVAGFAHRIGEDLLATTARQSNSSEASELLADVRRQPRRSLIDLSEILPMTEFALQNSLAVLTHSVTAAGQFRHQTVGQVFVAPLPTLHSPVGETPVPRDRSDFVLIVAGMINPNKCVDRLLLAVAASDVLRGRVHVRVVGEMGVEQRDQLRGLAVELSLEHRLHLTGSLSTEDYQAELESADAFVCLRDPVLEAASASLLDEMGTGRPVVVYDHGHYSELPADVVLKVDPGGGERALIDALERLARDAALGLVTGQRGRDHVERLHTPKVYAGVLLDAGESAMSARTMVDGIRSLGYNLSALDLSRDDYARRSAAAAVAELFAPDEFISGEG